MADPRRASCMRCGDALTLYHGLADCVTALRDQRAALLAVARAAFDHRDNACDLPHAELDAALAALDRTLPGWRDAKPPHE